MFMSIKTSIKEWVKWHFLMERSIRKYVASLPRCSKYIVISSADGFYEGKCKIVLEAKELLHCLETEHVRDTFFAGVDNAIVKNSILIWLRNADHSKCATTFIPEQAQSLIQAYFSTFIKYKEVGFFVMLVMNIR